MATKARQNVATRPKLDAWVERSIRKVTKRYGASGAGIAAGRRILGILGQKTATSGASRYFCLVDYLSVTATDAWMVRWLP